VCGKGISLAASIRPETGQSRPTSLEAIAYFGLAELRKRVCLKPVLWFDRLTNREAEGIRAGEGRVTALPTATAQQTERGKMLIRRLHEGDNFTDLVLLSKAFFLEYAGCHRAFFELDCLNDKDIEAYFSSFVGDDDRVAFVAIEENRIVGYITVYVQRQPSYWKVKRVGHISGLMVGQEHRRSGVATQLLTEAKLFFAEHGVRYFTVYTAVENKSGVAFYQAQGMEALHTNFLGRIGPEG
jgi:ribosomal protein S18 acetylase RimI-like enzyme